MVVRISEYTAAGCSNHGRYAANPQYFLELPEPSTVLVRLMPLGDPAPAINVSVFALRGGGEVVSSSDAIASSGTYTNAPYGVVVPPRDLEAGSYAVVPSTFDPQDGDFMLLVFASCARASLALSARA